ncbi:MAG: hypothetical protein KJ556_20290, partial [Gammaproteobacteria bacterium]|nr:hypothetical protein [Gammaproteobacteria bacterium]
LGTGNYTDAGDWSMPLEDTRVNMPFAVESQGCGASFPIGPYPVVLWTFWAYTDLIVPKAMDVGRHNSSVVYVSANDKILRTSNGGITWEDYITDHGANDIECHQAQWSADEDITYWADDGHLYRASDGDYGSGLYLELSPVNTPYRISSDPVDGWPIYALPYSDTLGGNLIKIEQSSTNLVKLDLSLPIALHSTIGATVADRRYYFLDGSGIWYSSDGESFSDKQGGWTAYGSPRNIMPLGG